MPDTPLNPDALMGRVAGIIDSACELYGATVDGDPGEKLYGEGTDLPIRTAEKVMELIRPHLAAAQPEVRTVEELDALPAGTLVKSGGREFYKTSYVDLPWILPYGVDRFGSSYLAKHSKVTVIHRPEVKP